METISFPAQAFNENAKLALPFVKIQSQGSVGAESNASTARSSYNCLSSMEDDPIMCSPPTLSKQLKLTKSSSFRTLIAPFKGDISNKLDSEGVTKSPTLLAPQSKIKININVGFFLEKKEIKVAEEPESDDEFEQECKDDTPSDYLCQGNAQKQSLTVRLGKRTHR